MAGRTGACAQAGDLPTGPNQTRIHAQGQWQTQAAGHLNPWDRVCIDGSECWCWSRSSKPTFHRNSTPTVPGETLSQQAVVEVEELLFRRPSWKVWTPTLRTTSGASSHAELLKPAAARRIVDRRVLHLIRMWLDRPVEETDDRSRHRGGGTTEARYKRRGIPQGLPISHLAGEYLHALVHDWHGDVRVRRNPRLTARDLRRRPRDPVQKGQGRSGLATTAGDHGQAEAHGERGKDAHLQSAGRGVGLPGLHVWANVFGEDRPSSYRLPAVKEKAFSARSRKSTR